MRIAWIGFHQEGIPALRALAENGYQLQAVITLTLQAAAKRSASYDYPALCRQLKLPLHQVADINHPTTIALLQSLDLDLVFVIGWSQILKPETLQTARIGMIGTHASLLPHNRGSAPINWAIIKGEGVTGNTLIWLSPQVDAGAIIDQVPFPITPYDTCDTLYRKVAQTNKTMILKVLPRLLAGDQVGIPQDRGSEAVLPRRRPRDGIIDWGKTNTQIYDFIRALTRPYPGAFSFLAAQRWLIWKAALLPGLGDHHLPPGTIIGPVVSPQPAACGQLVAAGAGFVLLLEIENEEGQALSGPALSDQSWSGKVWSSGE
jgi:methionyl-tRNA formyltransferase